MARLTLPVHRNEVSAAVLEGIGSHPGGEALAAAIRRFLREHQPWIAERMEVEAEGDHAVVAPRAGPGGGGRAGERPLELLRAVQGVLGMADKLPGFLGDDELPEIGVDGGEFGLQATMGQAEALPDRVELRSRARYFPFPEAEWFEVCEGELTLTREHITFDSPQRIQLEQEEQPSRRHVISIAHVTGVGRDTWLHIPCLRVDTARRVYRYGWPSRRPEPESCLDIGEWQVKLKSLLRKERQP